MTKAGRKRGKQENSHKEKINAGITPFSSPNDGVSYTNTGGGYFALGNPHQLI